MPWIRFALSLVLLRNLQPPRYKLWPSTPGDVCTSSRDFLKSREYNQWCVKRPKNKKPFSRVTGRRKGGRKVKMSAEGEDCRCPLPRSSRSSFPFPSPSDACTPAKSHLKSRLGSIVKGRGKKKY